MELGSNKSRSDKWYLHWKLKKNNESIQNLYLFVLFFVVQSDQSAVWNQTHTNQAISDQWFPTRRWLKENNEIIQNLYRLQFSLRLRSENTRLRKSSQAAFYTLGNHQFPLYNRGNVDLKFLSLTFLEQPYEIGLKQTKLVWSVIHPVENASRKTTDWYKIFIDLYFSLRVYSERLVSWIREVLILSFCYR